MNVRPSPRTPYELKKRLEEEQAYYENFASGFAVLAGLKALMIQLANVLDAASHALRSVAATEDRPHSAA